MTAIDVIGSQPGRVLRIAAGVGLLFIGLRRGTAAGRVVGIAGLVPLTAGVADVCVLGPLVGGPLRGRAFRAHRARAGKR